MAGFVGESYKRASLKEPFDAIVIGSGIGGMTAAALLAKYAGKRVLVLERHYTAGGFTHTFHRPGYEWDVGVHYIGEAGDPNSQIARTFDSITGGRLNWSSMGDVYDRVVIAGRTYDFVAGLEAWRDRLLSYFPGEKRAIDAWIAAVQDAAAASRLFFAEKALPGPLSRVAGSLMRARFLKYARRTTAEVVNSITDNRELAALLTAQWGNYGEPPATSSFGAHAIVTAHYFGGASYPVGGATAIAFSILPEIESTGGQVLVGAEVSQILLDAQRRAVGVRMADGREIRSAIVISDAGARNTFTHLLPDEGMLGRISSVPASSAHLSLYVGLRGTAREMGLPRTNLWIHPGSDTAANARSLIPFLFISFPSAKDPAFEQRHPGRATIEVVTMASFSAFEQWAATRWKRRGPEYDDLKQQLAARLRSELEAAVPAVRGRIEHVELSTPLTTAHFSGHERGEIYGLAHTPARFGLRCLQPATPFPNLFLTGADAAVSGVAGGLMGGVLCASRILRRNLLSAISKGQTSRRVFRQQTGWSNAA